MSTTDRVTVLSLDHPAATDARTESDDPTFDAVWAEFVDNASDRNDLHDFRLALIEAVISSKIRLTATVLDYMRALSDQFALGPNASTAEFTQFAADEIHRIAAHQQTPTKETHMNEVTYDTGLPDSDATLAEQINESGIETVAASIVAESGSSVQADLDADPAGTFDPDQVGMTPVLALVDSLTSDDDQRLALLDSIQSACYKTVEGEPNEQYVTQVWLDGDLGESRLYVAWIGGEVFVIATTAVTDSDSDFTTNVPTHLRRFLTEDAAREWARQYRPKPTAAERAARQAERFEAAALLRKALSATS